ncbi:MAG: YcaQ family DNA glycosylase [Hyphomicrobiaceae bacterium]|nr:YcaQ family DNA glycosylase [Hyphomicrobiaceae bacterium]
MAPRKPRAPTVLGIEAARNIWIAAQRLNEEAPFGSGPEAVHRAVSHLGYVQIDTINIVERCHHHILFSRIPAYRRADLHAAQSEQKTLFEYWTHALAYLPIEAFPYYARNMRAHRTDPQGWGGRSNAYYLRKVLKRIEEEGPLSSADFQNDRLVEKAHLWASRKPSKNALQSGFYSGRLAIARRKGINRYYDLMERHFGWEKLPKPATRLQKRDYEIDRALTAQGFVSLDSICHLTPAKKPEIEERIERRVKRRDLVECRLEGDDKTRFFVSPVLLNQAPEIHPGRAHILSPFDPLIIQRKRTSAVFGHDHIFEAYLPAEKRQWGYFTLPVLVGNRIVAGLDLKADRPSQTLQINAWHWFAEARPETDKPLIEAALDRFSAFQFGD